MDSEPIPSIVEAIEQGRGTRGAHAPRIWVNHRARVLTAARTGLHRVRLAGEIGVAATHLRTLLAEACDAVLRGGAQSAEAEAVCLTTWHRWCNGGDGEACARLRRGKG